jgi:serine protease Do
MSRRFLALTVSLTATVAFLVGLVVAGSMSPSPAHSAPEPARAVTRTSPAGATAPALASFADVAEKLNPAVVNIDAVTRGTVRPRRRLGMELPDGPEMFGRPSERERQGPRRGTGTGFIIDSTGYILTNHHVIEDAERISVRLKDGRTLKAEAIGSDPDTDIALIKVEPPGSLSVAALGDSDTLRVGEWVLAIGNPLAYEHTVTVGVVSFIGRKLFDSSFDRYIQTDAAINFGNSGGPLINARGEVVGINAAVSSRASSIGFAVPINQARAILPQLREQGRVSRGYIGVALRNLDEDLRRSLGLKVSSGALVQDVTPGSPGERAGLRVYDVIVAVDGAAVGDNDSLIGRVAARRPGTTAMLSVLRDGRPMSVAVKLAERPPREAVAPAPEERPLPSSLRGGAIGLSVRELDRDFGERFEVPDGTRGVVVSRVEPLSPAFDAGIERGHVIIEVNRQPVRSIEDYRRLTASARAGDVFAFYLFKPESGRALHTVRVD